MTQVLHITQIVSAIALIALILLQRAQTDTGGFSGDNGSFTQSRRGFERFIFILTIIVAVIFTAVSLIVIIRAG